MVKWADYGISKVKYNSDRTHISAVTVHADQGDTISSGSQWSRSQVVDALGHGRSFVTILEGTNGKWRKGQDIHTVVVNNVKYIRTDQNRRSSDNLGSLPEF